MNALALVSGLKAKAHPVAPKSDIFESQMVPRHVVIGDLTFDVLRHSVSVNGKKMLLVGRAYQILLYLALRSAVPSPVSKEDIRTWVYGQGELNSTVIETFIVKVRKELREVKSAVQLRTVLGIGYQLVADSNVKTPRNT